MMDITESMAVSRRYNAAREHVAACESVVASFEMQMEEATLQSNALYRRIVTVKDFRQKARLIALRDDALSSLKSARRNFVKAQEELARVQKVLELLEKELDNQALCLGRPFYTFCNFIIPATKHKAYTPAAKNVRWNPCRRE